NPAKAPGAVNAFMPPIGGKKGVGKRPKLPLGGEPDVVRFKILDGRFAKLDPQADEAIAGLPAHPGLPRPEFLEERALRKEGKFAELSLRHHAAVEHKVNPPGMQVLVPPPLAEPFALREYAH